MAKPNSCSHKLNKGTILNTILNNAELMTGTFAVSTVQIDLTVAFVAESF